MLKKRVLVTSIFPLFVPFLAVRFFTLAKNLVDAFDFTFLIRGPLPEKNRWLDDCNIVEVPSNVQIIDYLSWGELIRKTIKLAKQHDILFPSKAFSVTGAFCFFLSHIMKKGFVQDADDYESAAVKWYYFQEKISEFILRKTVKNVSVASIELLKRYWPQGRYIPNCLDLELFNPYRYDRDSLREKVRKRLGIDYRAVLLVWASYFSGQEDNSYMPMILGQVANYGQEFHLALLGGSPKGSENSRMTPGAPHIKDIFSRADKAGIPRSWITATGRLPFYDYIETLIAADAILVPLRNHPFDICKSPGKLFYPMALEVPVIATDVGEPAYVLSRAKCGILISYNDTKKAAEQIVSFMKIPYNERRTMGISGRRYLESQYNAKIVAKDLGYLLEKSLKDKNKSFLT